MDILSEKTEQQLLQFFCLLSEHHCYDLMIGYTNQFYGKAVVTSIQSGKMVLLCQEDINNPEYWTEKLEIAKEDIKDFQEFFRKVLQIGTFPEHHY